ncbi:MAG: hypothetical protein K2H20_03410, partial [Bacilli bacterium]|nr:hypothetical protein [Bacilli bacterium]
MKTKKSKIRTLLFAGIICILATIACLICTNVVPVNAATSSAYVNVGSTKTTAEYVYTNNGKPEDNKNKTRYGYKFTYYIQRSRSTVNICLEPATELFYVQNSGQCFTISYANSYQLSYSASNTVTDTLSSTVASELSSKIGASYAGLSAEVAGKVSASVTATYTSSYSSSFGKVLSKSIGIGTNYYGGNAGTWFGLTYECTGYHTQVVVTKIERIEEKSVNDCGWKWQSKGTKDIFSGTWIV